jgi:hypothetical protein
MPSLAPAMVYSTRLRARDSVLLKSDRSLSQQPAINRRAGLHGDRRFGQYYSCKVRSGPDRDATGDLPKDILGLCAARQSYFHSSSFRQSPGNLKDPNCVRGARERNVR